jgi:alkylation response protein AidB-like acyl-CoA dehydrogenase
MDAFVALRLLRAAKDAECAEELAAIGSGELRVLVAVVAHADWAEYVEYQEAAGEATHVLIVDAATGHLQLRAIASVTETPGLPVPTWSTVQLGPVSRELRATADAVDEALVLIRLGLAVRAAAAAERSHEMAIEHATTRVQFKRIIGSFGAVQQRTATCQIDVTAGQRLIEHAVSLFEEGSGQWRLAAEIATAHARRTAPQVQLGAHHTLAAIGYFEEHDAPWLFRRVHADIARIGVFARPTGEVADVLAEAGTTLPSFALGERAEQFRAEVREFFAAHATIDEFGRSTYDENQVIAAIAERGWLGFGWAPEYGGRSASLAEQVVLAEEITYGRVPVHSALAAVMIQGETLIKRGTPEQQAEFLPLIRNAGLRPCLGYSEPEAGSDLASLRTRAERDGDHWVINGQKLWTTNGHRATHVWLATRTDPDAKPKHAGITLFLVPMTTPGITVQQHRALSGEISCSVFYDDVRVPDTARIGEVNGGWRVITDALAGERVLMGGVAAELRRQLDELLEHARTDPTSVLGPRGSARRARLGDVAVRLQATRALVSAAVAATSDGDGARLEAPMAAVLGGEAAEDMGEAMLEILGPQAALTGAVPGAGSFQQGLRLSLMYVVGGGTNDVQRGMIARALGLPRE